MWKLNIKSFSNLKEVIKTHETYDKYLFYLTLSGIIILTLIVYSGTFKNGFTTLWDDDKQIIHNDDIKDLTTANIRKMFTNYYVGMYQPLSTLSYAVEYKFFALNPVAYHTDNLLIHIINILLVFSFIYTLSSKLNISVITALFFGIHPMNVETIAYVSARSNNMYTLFFLGGLITYIYYAKSQQFTVQRPQYLLYTYILFILSLLSKSAAVCFPLVLILIDYFINSSKFKVQSLKYWVNKLPFFLIAIIFGIISIYSRKSIGLINDIDSSYSLFDRFLLISYSASFYIFRLFLPTGLCAWHFYPVKSGVMLPIEYYLSAAFLIAIVIFVISVKSAQLRKVIIFGLLFYLSTIFLVLQIIPFQKEITSERYAYIPYIGLFFAGIGICQKITEANKIINQIFISFILITALIFSVMTYERNKVWVNSLCLVNDFVKKYPGSDKAYLFRALLKYDEGDKQGAIQDFNKVVEINPKNPDAFNYRGIIKSSLGDLRGAIEDYNKSIEINPKNANAINNRGNAKHAFGDKEGACSDWKRAEELGQNEANDMINNYCN
jgi:protein O-mannosyl-transferase